MQLDSPILIVAFGVMLCSFVGFVILLMIAKKRNKDAGVTELQPLSAPPAATSESAEAASSAIQATHVYVPIEPDPALLISMATRLTHGFGLLSRETQDSMIHDMRKLHDEVVGNGFYNAHNRRRYLETLNPSNAKTGGGSNILPDEIIKKEATKAVKPDYVISDVEFALSVATLLILTSWFVG